MKPRLDTDLLQRHLQTFLGYGNPRADVWFVGPEQGGAHDLGEIGRRLGAWTALGEASLVDLHEYHRKIGQHNWLAPKPRIQSTWGKLIRTYLTLRGEPTSADAVRSCQATRFGSADGDTAVVDLMPLPCKSMKDWIFGSIDLPYLRTRQSYIEALLPQRLELFRSALETAKPEAVVFYGLGYADHWHEIVGEPVARDADGIGIVTSGATTFAIAPHPTSFGATNALFEAMGQRLASAGGSRKDAKKERS